jgi:hypothetical protein
MENMLVTEAAVALGVSRERAIRMIQGGRLDGRLVAGRWVVSAESVFELRRALRRGGAVPAGIPETAE